MAQPNVFPRFLKAGTEPISVYPRFLWDGSTGEHDFIPGVPANVQCILALLKPGSLRVMFNGPGAPAMFRTAPMPPIDLPPAQPSSVFISSTTTPPAVPNWMLNIEAPPPILVPPATPTLFGLAEFPAIDQRPTVPAAFFLTMTGTMPAIPAMVVMDGGLALPQDAPNTPSGLACTESPDPDLAPVTPDGFDVADIDPRPTPPVDLAGAQVPMLAVPSNFTVESE